MNEKSILNPKFKYTSATKTDIKKTFKRIREEQAKAKQDQDVQKVQCVDEKLDKVK